MNEGWSWRTVAVGAAVKSLTGIIASLAEQIAIRKG